MTNPISGPPYYLYTINQNDLDHKFIEKRELALPPTSAQLAVSIDEEEMKFLLKTGQVAGTVFIKATLLDSLDNKEKEILKNIFPPASVSMGSIDLLDLFGLKILACTQSFIDRNHIQYKEFFELFSDIELYLNRTIPEEEAKSLGAIEPSEEKFFGTIESLVERWKKWEKTLKSVAERKIYHTSESSLRGELERELEELEKYTNCFRKMLNHSDKRKCFFSNPYSLSLVPPLPNKVNEFKSERRLLKTYVSFVFAYHEISVHKLNAFTPHNKEKFIEILETEKKIKEEIVNAKTCENYLSCLSLIHKECRNQVQQSLSIRSLLDQSTLKAKNHKDLVALFKRCDTVCLRYVRSLACMYAFISLFAREQFPEHYPKRDASEEKKSLVRRLSYNLVHLLCRLNQVDSPFQGAKETAQGSREMDSLSLEEQEIVQGVSDLFSAYFSPLIRELDENWLTDWYVIERGGALRFASLEDRPTSFVQEMLKEPVKRFQDYTTSNFFRFKEDVFAFFVDEALPKLPAEKREIDYLRKLMQHVPLLYYSYVLSMTDGAKILGDSFYSKKKSFFFEDFASLFYLEDIKKFIDIKQKSELAQSDLLESSAEDFEENKVDLALKEDPVFLEEEISEELEIEDLKEGIETQSFIQVVHEKKSSKIQRNKKSQSSELAENVISKKQPQTQQEIIQEEIVEEFFNDLRVKTISGRELLKFLTNRLGFDLKSKGRTTGSHRTVFNKDLSIGVTVPTHEELSIGVVKSIRDQVFHSLQLKKKES